MKHLITVMLIIFVLVGPTLASQAEGRGEYQTKDNDYPGNIQKFPLIRFGVKAGTIKVSYLRYESASLGDHTPIEKDRFDTRTVLAGKEFGIRGYWISKSLIDAYKAKVAGNEDHASYQGAGELSYDEIMAKFRSPDIGSFVGMLAKLAELRRSPESSAEVRAIRNRLDPMHSRGSRDFVHRIALGTGMVEVEDPAATGADARKRRFIPLNLIRTGAIRIDPQGARLKVLRSIVIDVVSNELPLIEADDSATEQRVRQTTADLNHVLTLMACRSSPCATQSVTFSNAVENVLKIGLVDHSTEFDIMDPDYQKELNDAELDKLSRIMKSLRRSCLP